MAVSTLQNLYRDSKYSSTKISEKSIN